MLTQCPEVPLYPGRVPSTLCIKRKDLFQTSESALSTASFCSSGHWDFTECLGYVFVLYKKILCLFSYFNLDA